MGIALRSWELSGREKMAGAPGVVRVETAAEAVSAALDALRATGYDGEVSAEYNRKTETPAGLDWMPRFRKLLQ